MYLFSLSLSLYSLYLCISLQRCLCISLYVSLALALSLSIFLSLSPSIALSLSLSLYFSLPGILSFVKTYRSPHLAGAEKMEQKHQPSENSLLLLTSKTNMGTRGFRKCLPTPIQPSLGVPQRLTRRRQHMPDGFSWNPVSAISSRHWTRTYQGSLKSAPISTLP